jgi:hypothetical protein
MAERLLVLMCSILFVACASQGSPAGGGGSSAVAVATPTAKTGSNDRLLDVGQGCKVNLTEACEEYLARPTIILNDEQVQTARLLEATRSKSLEFILPVSGPNQQVIGTIRCSARLGAVNKVTSASLLPGAPISNEGITYLKKAGLCQQDNSTVISNQESIDKEIKRQEERVLEQK